MAESVETRDLTSDRVRPPDRVDFATLESPALLWSAKTGSSYGFVFSRKTRTDGSSKSNDSRNLSL